jgi:hypothetical protein
MSPTIATLTEALERSDVIVHIEYKRSTHAGVLAETRLVTQSGGQRYVRISLDPKVFDREAIALLGHELQHASEIAEARWVADEATMIRLFETIGHRADSGPGRRTRVDTAAGPATARQVIAELRNARPAGVARRN